MQKLDLHGLSHDDAKNEVIRFIESNWNTGNEISIIHGNSKKMRLVVIRILEEYGLKYTTQRFSPKLSVVCD